MLDSLLAETVGFPMNYVLPLVVLFAVVMAALELVRKDRSGPAFWVSAFSAIIFLMIGWPPQFMQGSPQQATPAHTAPEAAAAVASSR